MRIGAFSPEIQLDTVEAVFAEAKRLGFTEMQYDFVTSHGEEMPEAFLPGELDRIAEASKAHGIQIIAINGTFNMIDRDLERRREYTARFERIAEACRALDCNIITICTGTRSDQSMWSFDPESASEDAWSDLIDTTRRLLPIAERYKVTLGVETEASNVVFSIGRTRKYLDEINSPWLKVIMDCANLFPAGAARLENVRPTIELAFEQLGKDIILAHGKDIMESETIQFTAPGMGIVDYDLYFRLLKKYGYDRGFILHGIHCAEEFKPSIHAMEEKLQAAGL